MAPIPSSPPTEFDFAWCPVCNTQIVPKLISVPVSESELQLSPSKEALAKRKLRQRGGLVQGTGRMRPNGSIKSEPAVRFRTVFDTKPLPLYCSAECEKLDARSVVQSVSTQSSSSTQSDSSVSTASSAAVEKAQAPVVVTPPQPGVFPEYIAKFAKMYNWSTPPPSPIKLPEPIPEKTPEEKEKEKHKVLTLDVYSISFRKPKARAGSPPPPPRPRPSYLPDTFSATPSSETVALVNQFSESLSRRCESRSATYGPPPSPSSPRRERSLLAPGAEGKLLVPDVKLKARTGSGSSLNRTRAPSTTATSSNSSEPNKPTYTTRPWSYDKYKTYDYVPLPRRMEKRKVEKEVDGQTVEVELEVDLPPKRLFLFPPTVVRTS